MPVLQRDTLFKLAGGNKQDRDRLIEAYQVLAREARKDGKPYIADVEVRPLLDHKASQGYTLRARTSFASAEDMRYFDSECPAHKALKERVMSLGSVLAPPLVLVTELEESV
ncbi:hypothetical protein MYCTH_99971 [Thermothelomyces thermophilus ATCC 42464]|uniref:Stress-response A/B barrel domain-containing protein n=1 Tax=Thermothelomyces thermophilus (strain ATCC 42464 / BCRC 31852 / DSM 1799) TaxID=573729 RepID=G2Q6G3_THET4|nr:uncharacterized protein MYCTH_99971 [Thermothelomyces thermophilus ATCC 42464]AEO54735.1 hypothetical protein MYCTH_99971 [Thermothelomyces thermophilus ATCC 42464]